MKPLTTCAVFVTSIIVGTGRAAACPNCKEALAGPAGSDAGSGLAFGFELSIYLMLSAPLLIACGLAGLFYLQIQKAKKFPELWKQADPSLAASEWIVEK